MLIVIIDERLLSITVIFLFHWHMACKGEFKVIKNNKGWEMEDSNEINIFSMKTSTLLAFLAAHNHWIGQ